MAKSSRASSRKANNQRLKKHVFGPVELARAERLSAKLLEIASQPKPEPPPKPDVDMEIDGEQVSQPAETSVDENDMDLDPASKPAVGKPKRSSKRIEKKSRRKSSIVFAKFKDRRSKTKKRT